MKTKKFVTQRMKWFSYCGLPRFRYIYVENQKIRWSHEGRDFNGIPFIILGTKVSDCQHGKDGKSSAQMKAKKSKTEKKLNLLFVKLNLSKFQKSLRCYAHH